MARETGTFNFPSNFEVNKQGPIDARLKVQFLSDLENIPFAYKGMCISVTEEGISNGGNVEDNGLYVLNGNDKTVLDNWKQLTTEPGLPTGGTSGQILAKNSGTDYDVTWIDPSTGTSGGTSGTDGTSGTSGTDGLSGTSGTDGTSGVGVPIGGTSGQVLSKSSDNDYDTEWRDPLGGRSGNTYLVRIEYDDTQTLIGGYFVDPSGNGKFSTQGAGVGPPNGNLMKFEFTNEASPPVSILALAYNATQSTYRITHLNAGGDDINHIITDLSFSSYTSELGVSDQYDADVFNSFNNATIELDLSKDNFDWVRQSGGFDNVKKEAHIYIMFQFII